MYKIGLRRNLKAITRLSEEVAIFSNGPVSNFDDYLANNVKFSY